MAGLGATKTSRDEHQQDDAPSHLFRSGSAGSYGTILALQRAVGNDAVGQLLRPDHNYSGIAAAEPEASYNGTKTPRATLQASSRNGQANNAAEQQADRAAETVIQSKGSESHSRSLIVADDAPRLDPGQMRKNDFLNLLETSVTRAAEEELKGTIWSAMGCPYIERWFSHYRSRDSRHVEGALRKYAPEAAGAGSAREYIPILTERVRRGIAQWTQTGDTTGVPEEFTQGGMPGATLQGLVGGVLSGIGGHWREPLRRWLVESAARSRASARCCSRSEKEARMPARIRKPYGDRWIRGSRSTRQHRREWARALARTSAE